jgi:hypothetical protein
MPISNALKMAAEKTAEVMQAKDLMIQEIFDFPSVFLVTSCDREEGYIYIGTIRKNGIKYYIKMRK